MINRILIAVSFAYAFLFLFALWNTAPAHEWIKAGRKIDARWIMKDSKTKWCCGPKDCEPVPGRVSYTPAGWAVKGLVGTVPDSAVYWTNRKQPWACRNVPTKKIRCLLLPGAKN